MAIDVVGVVIITVDITMDVDMAMPGADKQAGETNGVAIMTGARSSQRSEVRTYDRAFDFNHIEDDIVDCLYCNSRVNSVNVSIIRNSGQLKISSRLTLNSKDFDPDRYFYNAHQVTDVLLGR